MSIQEAIWETYHDAAHRMNNGILFIRAPSDSRDKVDKLDLSALKKEFADINQTHQSENTAERAERYLEGTA